MGRPMIEGAVSPIDQGGHAGLRIVMLTENQPVPPDRRVLREAWALRDAGQRVTVVCPQGPGQPLRERADGIRYMRYPPRHSGGGVAGYVAEYANALARSAACVLELAFGEGVDVIHSANPPDLNFLIAGPLKLLGKRYIFDQHDLSPELYATRFHERHALVAAALRGAELASYKLADAVIVPNESYASIAVNRGRLRPASVHVVRNGPPQGWPSEEAPEPNLKRGRARLVLYTGVMGPQDGVDVLLRAVDILVHELGETDLLCALLGDGDAVSGLKRLAGELEIAEHVEFCGWVADERLLARYLATADVCVCPEPSSPLNDVSSFIKVVEYMAARRPICAFDLPQTRRTAGQAAVLVPAGDEHAFATAIRECLRDPALCEKTCRHAAARTPALRWEAQVPSLMRAYAGAHPRFRIASDSPGTPADAAEVLDA